MKIVGSRECNLGNLVFVDKLTTENYKSAFQDAPFSDLIIFSNSIRF